MQRIIGALIVLMSSPSFARPVSIYFGDFRKMPYELDFPAVDALTFDEAVFGRLVIVDQDFELRPGLLERFYFDQDLKGYVLVVRKDVEFSNGRKATAADLEFSILRGFFTKRSNFFAVYLGNINGVEGIIPGTAYQSGLVKGVRVLDERRLLVTLKAPNPSFLHSLGNLLVRLVPREELMSDLFTWRSLPLGAGAYRVKARDLAKFEINLEAKNKGDLPREFKLFYSADGAKGADISSVPQENYARVRSALPISVTTFCFGNGNPLARNPSFRKALAHAIDKKAFLTENFEEARELLPPAFWGRSTPSLGVDLATRFTSEVVKGRILNLSAKASEAKLGLSRIINDAIIKLGAKSEVSFSAHKFLDGPGDGTAAIFGLSILTNYFDPLIMFNSFGPESPLAPLTLKANPTFMDLFNKAARASDFTARMDSIRSLSKFMVEEAYVIPIGFEYSEFFWNPLTIASVGSSAVAKLIHLDEVRTK